MTLALSVGTLILSVNSHSVNTVVTHLSCAERMLLLLFKLNLNFFFISLNMTSRKKGTGRPLEQREKMAIIRYCDEEKQKSRTC
jgi:hypothetical protein